MTSLEYEEIDERRDGILESYFSRPRLAMAMGRSYQHVNGTRRAEKEGGTSRNQHVGSNDKKMKRTSRFSLEG